MKAVILAGGKGTRGKPYTDYIPKAMIPVEGRPAIARVADFLLSSPEIDEAIILADLAGLGGQIRNYFENSQHAVSFVQDSQSGTGGDLLHLAPRLRDESEFLLWFVDNLCGVDVAGMRAHFKAKGSTVCVATRTRRKEETGFASVLDGTVKKFVEKPILDLPMHECLGIYVLSTTILDTIRERSGSGRVNFSFDILEREAGLGRVSAFDIGGLGWIDVESPATLKRNERLTRRIIEEMERSSPSQT